VSGDHWFVDDLRCADGSLCTGVTADSVPLSAAQRRPGLGHKRSRRPTRLVYREEHRDRHSALRPSPPT
jgi:predicted GIY-YIG superfamily endonuclease